jgi:hypothetical protein
MTRPDDRVIFAAEEHRMPTQKRIKKNEAPRADDGKARKRKDAGWDDRLRLVGDARFTEVEWSGRDDPSWPLPKK